MIQKIRFVLLAFIVCIAVAVSNTLAQASASLVIAGRDDSYNEFAHAVIAQLFSAIRTNEKARRGDPVELEQIVLHTIAPHTDFEAMTRAAVGRAWRDIDPKDRMVLVAEFRTLLIRLYSGMLAQYANYDYRTIVRVGRSSIDEAIIVVELRQPGYQGGVVVRVHVFVRTDADGTRKITDLSVDGVSMIQSYRDGFRGDIERLGVSGLIQKLRRMNGTSR